jgi:hypothetical protein
MVSKTEDNLQKAAHLLNQIITGRGLTISVQKTELAAFKGQQGGNKIAVDNKIMELQLLRKFGIL